MPFAPKPGISGIFGRMESAPVACPRLSDSGEDAKEKGTRKVGGAGERVSSCFFFFFFFHVRAASKPAAITRGSNYVRACFFAR